MCTDCAIERTPRLGVAAPPLPEPESVTPDLKIYPRDAWAGTTRQPIGELYPESVQILIVHHTAGPNDYDEAGAIAEMQLVYDYHTGPQKLWADVAYNFFIDRFGRVFEGRAGSLGGAVLADATGGNQGFGQLVCLLGDFTTELPSDEAQQALTKTLSWMADRFNLETGPTASTAFVSRGSNRWPEGEEVTTNTIVGHRDMSQTLCPGDAFYPMVDDEFPDRVNAFRSGQSVTAAPTTASSDTTVATSVAPTSLASSVLGPTNPVQSTGPVERGTALPDRASATELFAKGALGGVAAVGVVAGLAWVINRRQQLATKARRVR